ncbi:MAG: hypothetical protein ACRDRS_13615 [Pseudonocardiaceae bacterium]
MKIATIFQNGFNANKEGYLSDGYGGNDWDHGYHHHYHYYHYYYHRHYNYGNYGGYGC